MIVRPKFSPEDADRAFDEWGANCGPGAIAAICGLSLDELRPFMADFEKKGYTNPTLMWTVLKALRVEYSLERMDPLWFPTYGLARVQWEGPWTAPGVPIPVRYRHTHWVGSALGSEWGIFDLNCISNGSGWVSLSDWREIVVPAILKECEPGASGEWHLTHAVLIPRPASGRGSRL